MSFSPKPYFRAFVLAVLLLSFSSWGFFAHKQINKLAVFTLPPELAYFYKKHIDYLTVHAVDPDKRRYVNEQEASRHYLDTDSYGSSPFDSIPKKWDDAVSKYTLDTLMAHGTVPWQIERTYHSLVKAFRNHQLELILRYSADLGHYIADAHVPLHTTHNYNGQLTNQLGIHAFWESRLPELFAAQYNFFVGEAVYIPDPLEKGWLVVKKSFQLVDTVLLKERELRDSFAPSSQYAYEQRSNNMVKVYSQSFSTTYHQHLKGMVEQRMRDAIQTVGSFWYSAWIDAGQPDLSSLTDQQERDEAKVGKQDSLIREGRLLGREEWQ